MVVRGGDCAMLISVAVMLLMSGLSPLVRVVAGRPEAEASFW